MSSLADEIHFLFSGRGMPYEKVSLLVAIVITVFFTAAMGYNYTRDVNVVVVDLDHSRTSQEVVEMINSSPHMKVGHVLYTPADPKDFSMKTRPMRWCVCLRTWNGTCIPAPR